MTTATALSLGEMDCTTTVSPSQEPLVPVVPRSSALDDTSAWWSRTAPPSKAPVRPPTWAQAFVQAKRSPREIVSHHWECMVHRLNGETFSATLRSLRDPSESEKEAVIPVEEVTDDDMELLAVGAVFYWTIGYDISAGGTRKRTSQLKFRRLPAWSKQDIARVRSEGAELFELFGRKTDDASDAPTK